MMRLGVGIGLIARLVGIILFCVMTTLSVSADVLMTSKGEIEGRILENSAKVLVVETIAGEYVVVAKDQINGIHQEPEPEFYYRRAKLFENENNQDRALVNFLEVLNRDPDHSRAREGIDTIHYERKKAKWDAGLEQANDLLNNQEYRQALEAFQNVLEMEPEESLAQRIVRKMSDTHARLAYLYYNHCSDEDAILELAKAEELNPNSADIYYILGRIHQTDYKYDLARLEFERALEMNPDHSGARAHLEEVIEASRKRRYW